MIEIIQKIKYNFIYDLSFLCNKYYLTKIIKIKHIH